VDTGLRSLSRPAQPRKERALDAKAVFPSSEFSDSTKEALATPGTIMLPYPPPATGKIFIGINPDHIPPDLKLGLQLSGAPRFFLRVVQVVSPRFVITRIVDLRELRGVSVPAATTKEGGPSREFQTVSGVQKIITDAVAKLVEAEKKKAGVYEVLLFDDAVICVPESAPVCLGVKLEFAVNALEAAENVDALIARKGSCPCPQIGHFK
jgi:hypothetical protein